MEVDIAASTVEKLRTETAGRKERHSSNFRTDPSVDAAATFTAARFNVKTQHSITKRAKHHAAAARRSVAAFFAARCMLPVSGYTRLPLLPRVTSAAACMYMYLQRACKPGLRKVDT